MHLVPRRKNIEFLSKLGINKNVALEILKSLSVSNYYSGPEEDDQNRPCKIWKFKLTIEDSQVYIKIAEPFDKTKGYTCISFHD